MGISAGAISKLISEAKKNSPKRKFKQSFDLGISLLLDMSKPENRVDEEVVLPNGRGRQVRVGVIAEGELALQAKKVVDVVIPKKKLEELAKNKKAAKKFVDEIDFFVAQADLMQVIGKTLGTVIGPRGKMPKPVPVNANIKPLIEKLKKTVRVRSKERPLLQIPVGTEDMDEKQLAENINTIIQFLERKLERGTSSIKSIYLKTTMGPRAKMGV